MGPVGTVGKKGKESVLHNRREKQRSECAVWQKEEEGAVEIAAGARYLGTSLVKKN